MVLFPMPYWNLANRMKRRGLTNAYQLAAFAKITKPLASRVLSGERVEKLDMATLYALAKAFGVKKSRAWTLLNWTD